MNQLHSSTTAAFGQQLRHWRQHRKQSQLDLALTASVSQRHVSWLETGRSQPSRQMIVQLADALDIPLRERNALLHSAGFAPLYAERELGDDQLAPVLTAMELMLAHHDPFPAIVMNHRWHVKMTNKAANWMLQQVGGDALWDTIGDRGERSLARLTLHPDGLRPYIENWQQAAPAFLLRLRREALASGSEAEREEYESLLSLVGEDDLIPPTGEQLLPVLPLVLRAGDARLSLFSVLSTFGTAQDVTVDELRIESFFPADQATRLLFSASQSSAS